MDTPFVFGRIATNDNFTDRKNETAELVRNFSSLINTIIISPRRWGKSSLVHRAAEIAMKQDRQLRICTIDLFNVRNEARFYSLLAQKVLAATSSRWDEAVQTAKEFFSHLRPKFSIGTDPMSEISVDFDMEQVEHNPDEVLDLAEKIAREKGLKIVICIDEFQNISQFADPQYFQKRLRSHWQRHEHVAYCLYGSKRHMMLEVFTSSSNPFYKFGTLIFLPKISTDDLVAFFMERFADTGKSISPDAAELIAHLIDNHPYYAQQLAQLSWLRTTNDCTPEIVRQAHTALVEQLSLLFVNITETLTTQQINYMRALISGEETITSTEVMKRYGISSATAATRSKNALIKNDIIESTGGKLTFQDPVYAYWLRNSYFRW